MIFSRWFQRLSRLKARSLFSSFFSFSMAPFSLLLHSRIVPKLYWYSVDWPRKRVKTTSFLDATESYWSCWKGLFQKRVIPRNDYQDCPKFLWSKETLPETNRNIAPENRPKPNRKVVLLTIHFWGRAVSFREGKFFFLFGTVTFLGFVGIFTRPVIHINLSQITGKGGQPNHVSGINLSIYFLTPPQKKSSHNWKV